MEQQRSSRNQISIAPSVSSEEREIQMENLDRQLAALNADMSNPVTQNMRSRIANPLTRIRGTVQNTMAMIRRFVR